MIPRVRVADAERKPNEQKKGSWKAKSFNLLDILIILGRLFHKEGPMQGKVMSRVCYTKSLLSFVKLLHRGAN